MLCSSGYSNMPCIAGSVKKVVSTLGLLHDRSKLNDGLEKCRSEISHTKESKASINMQSHILNPATVLFLFKRMLDEVYFYIQLDEDDKCFEV